MSSESDERGRPSQDQEDSVSIVSSDITSSWNEAQETLLKGISERANCMRWLHNQCQLHFESYNFYLTIPNVIISTLNGSFTMSLNSLFPDPEAQKVATTIIGLISIFSAVLTTMNQYVKSQQMMEAHRAAGLSYSKLHRIITNELALRRDQRSNALEFLKVVRQEQDRLENTSPSILPKIISRFNTQFATREIEKPEIAGDLDETEVNTSVKTKTMRVVSGIGKALQNTIHSASASATVTPIITPLNGEGDKHHLPRVPSSIPKFFKLPELKSTKHSQSGSMQYTAKPIPEESADRVITNDSNLSVATPTQTTTKN